MSPGLLPYHYRMHDDKPKRFFQAAGFKVVKPVVDDGKLKRPKVDIKDEALFCALKLAKIGYYGGNPDSIMIAPYTTVLNMLAYEKFEFDYMEKAIEINKVEE